MAKPLELINVKDLTICESTAQMITKARNDGVELFFDRANSMKACPLARNRPAVKCVPWAPAG